MSTNENYLKGRGAQINTPNKFASATYTIKHVEAIDDFEQDKPKTKYIEVFPKTILNKIESPDLGMGFSMNPYQGCEHGCIYCYARNSHEYWGYSAGIEFEQIILVKKNAPQLLEEKLKSKNWKSTSIMFSGNTDCYQPAERKFEITRQCLALFLKYKHPVGIISKNDLILRDLDILKPLAELGLLHVSISITGLDESLRQVLEPRTVTYKRRLQVVEELSKNGIPVNVMTAPIIPAINSYEIPDLLKAAAEKGALDANYIVVRLNGIIGELFTDWLRKNFPDRAEKVLNMIKECHDGNLNDSRFGKRMRGDGLIADQISSLYKIAKRKYFGNKRLPPYNFDLYENQRDELTESQLKMRF